MRLSLVSRILTTLKHFHIAQTSSRFSSTGLFSIPNLKHPTGFDELEHQVYNECETLLKEAFGPSRQRKMVEIIDDVSNSICKLADLAECMRNLHPDEKFVRSAEECMARLSLFVERLNTDTSLYGIVKKYSNEGDETDQRIAQLFLTDFEASGVHLPSSERKKFVDLSQSIFRVGADFVRGCEKPVEIKSVDKFREKSSTTSRSLLNVFENYSNEHTVEYLDHPGSYSPVAEERENLYKIYYAKSEAQEKMLQQLNKSRHELAIITGFENFSHRALKDSIFDDPDVVDTFLCNLIKRLKPKVDSDLDELQPLLPFGRKIGIWDLNHLKSVYRRDKLTDLSEKLNNRFSIESTLIGLKEIVQKLYGVKFVPDKPLNGEVWHEDVEKFQVYDENQQFRGTIYCDWFDRHQKTSADSHFTVRCSKLLLENSPENEQVFQTPIVVLTFRFWKNQQSANFIGPGELANILHEFGHAMHSILGRTKYQHVAGTRCPTDFSEIPSNLMELYITEPRTFNRFGNRGEILTETETDQIIRSLKKFSDVDCLQQAIYALFDLRLHSGICQNTDRLYDEICQEFWPLMQVSGCCWHHRFSHLVPYASKYHAYLVARASALLIWRKLFAADPLSADSGRKWARVQSFGGELPPRKLLGNLLDEKLTPEKLCDALILS